MEKTILEYELSSIGTHTLIGRAISLFLKMGTKCFRNNAKLQPMRRNFFYNWELWKRTGSFIGNHCASVTLATLTEFFFKQCFLLGCLSILGETGINSVK